jgi:thioredoxin 1
MSTEPTRDEIDRLEGAVVLEFGASWCGHCLALAPQIAAELARFPQMRHIKIEDAKGKRLGRSFRVKLWPTLVFMLNGRIVAQAVRPNVEKLREGFERLAACSEDGR